MPLAVESVRLWPALDDELGYPTEFVQKGRLQVAVSEAEMGRYLTEKEVGDQFGVHVDELDPHEIRDMAPCVTDRNLGGIFFPKGAHANPQRSVQAFAWALQDWGGSLHQHTAVTGFKIAGERVAAVETSAGDIEADTVVCAAGPQTALMLEMVGTRVPLATARAEIIATAPLEPLFQMALVGNGLYGRQAKKGNLLYGGGPHEWIDVDLTSDPGKPNTPLIRNIARRLADLFPVVADVPVIRSWAGVIEQAPDSLPIIDILDNPSNFVYISASAHGFAIAAATGKVVSELVLHGETSVEHQWAAIGQVRRRGAELAGRAWLDAGSYAGLTLAPGASPQQHSTLTYMQTSRVRMLRQGRCPQCLPSRGLEAMRRANHETIRRPKGLC